MVNERNRTVYGGEMVARWSLLAMEIDKLGRTKILPASWYYYLVVEGEGTKHAWIIVQ